MQQPANLAAPPQPSTRAWRLALFFDYAEEQWPSMDLVAEMLLQGLKQQDSGLEAVGVRPPFVRRLGRLSKRPLAFNADRLLNRFWDLPREARRLVSQFDLFHVADHSYAQLVHALPAERTGVFCHDLDAFQCLLEPSRQPRPRWFRLMMRRVLSGLQKAALVFYSTAAVRRQIEAHALLDPKKLVHAPYGISPEFTTAESDDAEAGSILARLHSQPYLLHVGSCIPRKRIDVLLDVFAGVRARMPGLKLLKIGDPWPAERQEQIARLGIAADVVHATGLRRETLAALYRRAALVLMPSEAEGFGLPVIEALACGTPVVASDLPVLREVGDEAAVYCPVADVPAWIETICRLHSDPSTGPARERRLARAARFSWAAHARTIVDAYHRLLGHGPIRLREPSSAAER